MPMTDEEKKQARKDACKRYREANKEKVSESRRAYREANKEKLAEIRKKHYEANREEMVEYSRSYREENENKVKEYDRWYKQNNKEKMKESQQKYRENNKEKLKEIQKRSYEKHKEERKAKTKERYDNSTRLQLDKRISSAIRNHLSYSKIQKNNRKWEEIVGYTLEELMAHLESQFKDGMTWENRGSYWHIDHIKPKSWFVFETIEDPAFKECWALSNLQPLKAEENLSKGNRYSSIVT